MNKIFNVLSLIAAISFVGIQLNSTKLLANTISDNKNTIYVGISDGDDTIVASHIVRRSALDNVSTIYHSLISTDSFAGASELYNNLFKTEGELKVNYEYVSGMPQIFNDVSPGGLDKAIEGGGNMYPGETHLNPNIDGKTYEFKVAAIKKIIAKYLKNNPDSNIVLFLIGDNGEKDILVYDTIASLVATDLYKNRVSIGATFIHKIYDVKFNDDPKNEGIAPFKLKPKQLPFITFADLALQFRKLYPNLINEFETQFVLKTVRDDFNSSLNLDASGSGGKSTLPDWAEITSDDMKTLDKVFDSCKDCNLDSALLKEVKSLIHERVDAINN